MRKKVLESLGIITAGRLGLALAAGVAPGIV
jgi:hypothetical protein